MDYEQEFLFRILNRQTTHNQDGMKSNDNILIFLTWLYSQKYIIYVSSI